MHHYYVQVKGWSRPYVFASYRTRLVGDTVVVRYAEPLSGQMHTAAGRVTAVAAPAVPNQLTAVEAKVGSAVNTVAAVGEILCAISEKEYQRPTFELSEDEIVYRQRLEANNT